MKQKTNTLGKSINGFLQTIHQNITTINNSKIFAGIMIIVLQISSRFVTIKLSKTMESYLKYTFSRQVLIFAIAWMGTRDIYISLGIAILFTIVVDILLNEDCSYCVLPTSFKDYHIKLADSQEDSGPVSNPSLPPSAVNQSNKSNKELDNEPVKTEIVTQKDVEKALQTLTNAKLQSTWSNSDSFYKTN
jgi:hypothetical protein